MEKVRGTTTFFRAADGTKFFSEEDCDKYERGHSKRILDYIREQLKDISGQLSYEKEWVLPNSEKSLAEAKKRFKDAIAKGDWGRVTPLYNQYKACRLGNSQRISRYKRNREKANALIKRKEELTESKEYTFDEVFQKAKGMTYDSFKVFKDWCKDTAAYINTKKGWGKLYAKFLNTRVSNTKFLRDISVLKE